MTQCLYMQSLNNNYRNWDKYVFVVFFTPMDKILLEFKHQDLLLYSFLKLRHRFTFLDLVTEGPEVMSITCTEHENHLHTTWVTHAYHMSNTCIPHEYHMHTTWVSHAYHMSITFTPHENHIRDPESSHESFSDFSRNEMFLTFILSLSQKS